MDIYRFDRAYICIYVMLERKRVNRFRITLKERYKFGVFNYLLKKEFQLYYR